MEDNAKTNPPSPPASALLRVRVFAVALCARFVRQLATRKMERESRWRVLGRADAAMHCGQTRKARRLLERHLHLHPDDVDAWVLLGTSAGESPTALIQDLKPATRLANDTPILAFMLTLGYARAGDRTRALEWAQVAGKDSQLALRLKEDPAFAVLASSADDRN